MTEARRIVAHAHATLGLENYKVDIQAGRHRLTADEPASRGGAEAGTAPYELLLSGLVACTAITLRMYAERKGWGLKAVDVEARMLRQGDAARTSIAPCRCMASSPSNRRRACSRLQRRRR